VVLGHWQGVARVFEWFEVIARVFECFLATARGLLGCLSGFRLSIAG